MPGHQIQVDVKFLIFRGKDGKPIKRYQYTAIDDATRVRALKVYSRYTQANAIDFLDYVIKSFPFRIREVRTDNVLRAESALESSHDVSDCKIAPAASFWSTQIRDKPKARRLPRVMEKISSIANTGSRKRLALTVLNTSF